MILNEVFAEVLRKYPLKAEVVRKHPHLVKRPTDEWREVIRSEIRDKMLHETFLKMMEREKTAVQRDALDGTEGDIVFDDCGREHSVLTQALSLLDDWLTHRDPDAPFGRCDFPYIVIHDLIKLVDDYAYRFAKIQTMKTAPKGVTRELMRAIHHEREGNGEEKPKWVTVFNTLKKQDGFTFADQASMEQTYSRQKSKNPLWFETTENLRIKFKQLLEQLLQQDSLTFDLWVTYQKLEDELRKRDG